MTELNGAKVAGAGWVERNGVWYPTEKAADFMEEMVSSLQKAGWQPVGDCTMRKVKDDEYLLETKVQKTLVRNG